MASTENLTISISTATDQLEAGLSSALSKLTAFSASIAFVGVAAEKAFSFGHKIQALANQEADAIKHTQRLADSIGLSSDALIGMQAAASKVDVAPEQLEHGLFRIQRTVNDAAAGIKAAETALDALNLTASDLIGLPLEQQVGKIGKAMAGLSHGEQVGAVRELFGRNSERLIPFLTKGQPAIDAAIAGARKKGLTFSRTDAEQIEGESAAKRGFEKSIQGLGRKIAVEIAPAFEVIYESFSKAFDQADAINKTQTAAENLGTTIAGIADLAHMIGTAFDMAALAVVRLAQVSMNTGLIRVMGFLSSEVDEYRKKIDAFADEMQKGMSEGIAKRMSSTTYTEDLAAKRAQYAEKRAKENDPTEKAKQAAEAAADVNRKKMAQLRESARELAKSMTNELLDMGLGAAEAKVRALEREGLKLKWPSDPLLEKAQSIDKLKEALASPKGVGILDKFDDSMRKLKSLFPKEYTFGTIDRDHPVNAGRRAARQHLDEQLAAGAASTFDETRTPLEKITSKFRDLQEMFKRGTLDADTFGRAVGQLGEELAKGMPAQFSTTPGMTAGSQEALNTIAQSQQGMIPVEQRIQQGLEGLKAAAAAQVEINRRVLQVLQERLAVQQFGNF